MVMTQSTKSSFLEVSCSYSNYNNLYNYEVLMVSGCKSQEHLLYSNMSK